MKKYKINVMKWNLEKYNSNPLSYQKFQILLLMENANTHLVSLFKDYLLFDDSTEFFKEFYNKKEIYQRLKTIYDYYESSSYLFPNYTAINEGKYIYRNIIKKQKLIDYLEDLEDKKQEREEKKAKKNKNLNLYENEQNSSSCFDVFDSKVYNNIIKETGNDSKINELFCVINNNNEGGGDSFASIMRLAEEIKEIKDTNEKENKNNKEIKDKSKIKENKDKKENKENKENKETKENKDIFIYNKKDSNINLNNINNKIKNRIESKIYVSRRVGINQNPNPNQNSQNQHSNQNSINSKKIFRKAKVNININNILNNNFSNLNSKNITHNYSNRNQVIISDTCKSNEYLKNNLSNASYSNNKNNYKKNNIIINIINNNKTNNYQSNINYFSNYTSSNNPNENININSDSNRNNNLITTDSTKYNSINYKKYTSKNSNNKSKNNTTIKEQNKNELKSVIIKYSKNHSKKIPKKIKTDTKSKLLSFRLTTDINLTDRIKNGISQSKLNKSGKDQSKTKSLISPRNNKKKRTKTEILGTQSDIFLFGQQNEINPYSNPYSYNKSINRQILKNINLTNTHKPHKDISLINKKIINYHFGINSNKIEKKSIKHISTNSQNLTGIKIINKVTPLPLKEIVKKKIGVFSFNNTERTSRNHSKEQNNKHNTMIKRNHLDSFSPKKTQELIYKKMKKIYNKKSAIICSFFKSVGSNKKIKDLKIKKKINNSNINNNNYKGINSAINNKEIYNKTTRDKKF